MSQGWRYTGGLQLMDNQRPPKETISDNYKITSEFCEHGKSPHNLVKTYYKGMLAKPLRVIIRDVCDLDSTCVSMYRKVSNIRHTECQNLDDSHLVLQLSVPNPLKPSV